MRTTCFKMFPNMLGLTSLLRGHHLLSRVLLAHDTYSFGLGLGSLARLGVKGSGLT